MTDTLFDATEMDMISRGDMLGPELGARVAAAIASQQAALAESERVQSLMAKDWLAFCESMGVQFDTQEAVAYDLQARTSILCEALEPFAEPHAMGDNYVKFAPRLIEAARTALRSIRGGKP